MKKYLLLALAAFLLACTASGPQKTLDNLAQAMEDNNPQAFLAQIDMAAFSANTLKNMTENDEALSALSGLGQLLGLGSLDDLINSVVDIKAKIINQFTRGVSSGELMANCRTAATPDCPWVPQSLRKAEIVEIGANAAIAKITTPARMTSWLALHKVDNKWLVVGRAVLESHARAFATSATGQEPKAGTPPKSGQQSAVKI